MSLTPLPAGAGNGHGPLHKAASPPAGMAPASGQRGPAQAAERPQGPPRPLRSRGPETAEHIGELADALADYHLTQQERRGLNQPEVF